MNGNGVDWNPRLENTGKSATDGPGQGTTRIENEPRNERRKNGLRKKKEKAKKTGGAGFRKSRTGQVPLPFL